ncbi:hypothetical protein NUM3379_02970 [Kineococcus sp. NUM-3379]
MAPITPVPTEPGRRRRRRAGAVLVAGAAALTVGLTACTGVTAGSGNAAGSTGATSARTPLQVVNASVQKSSEASTGKFALSVDASGTSGGQAQQASLTGEGVFDTAAEAAEVRLKVDAPGVQGLSPTVRLVDDTLYVSGVPGVPAQQWVEMPVGDTASLGVDTQQLNPAAQLQQLRAVSQDVRELGASTVRGVRATGYAGSIDLQKALETAASPEEKAEAQKALQESGLKTLPFELYVDSEDRPVRMVLDLAVTQGAESGKAKVSMDYFDWGSPVTVTAPAPEAISDTFAGLAEGPGAAPEAAPGRAPAAAPAA